MYTFVWLQEASNFSNMKYLISTVCFLLVFLPANTMWSLDAWIVSFLRPNSTKTKVPYWSIWSLRVLFVIVYFHAGAAKINEDWLAGEPLSNWLAQRQDNIPFYDYIFGFPNMGVILSWLGLVFELIAVPMLLLSKSVLPWPIRYFILFSSFAFHAINKMIFGLGILPYMFWLISTIYFDPDWPEFLFRKMDDYANPRQKNKSWRQLNKNQKSVLGFLFIFLTIQFLFPFRSFLYTGNVNWTMQCYNFSWKFRVNDLRGGLDTKFWLIDPRDNSKIPVDVNSLIDNLQASKVYCNPVLMHQFAHKVANLWEEVHGRKPKVTVDTNCSLNYRQKQPMIDPEADLVSTPLYQFPLPWILPLKPRNN